MPKSSLHLALARQWEMLKKFPADGPGLTASQVTAWLQGQGYRVSKRTVERDLVELSTSFGIVCNDKSIPYGWHWMPAPAVSSIIRFSGSPFGVPTAAKTYS